MRQGRSQIYVRGPIFEILGNSVQFFTNHDMFHYLEGEK